MIFEAKKIVKVISSTQSTGNPNTVINWCTALGDGWYLPTISELRTIFSCKDYLNSSLKSIGCNIFSTGDYWSSSIDSSNYRSYINMRTGTTAIMNSANASETTKNAVAVRAL